MKLTKLAPLSILALAAFTGCSSGTEYEVTGEVTSAQAAAGTIVVEFFEELTPEGATEAERTSVHSVELTALGAFTENVEISEGATIVAVAIDDADGDGACTEGEAWGEATVTPNDDGTVDALALNMLVQPCPQ